MFIKKIVPTKIARDLRDTLFFSPNLKKKNEFLNLQVQKYEQGLEGNVFEKSKIQSTKKINFEVVYSYTFTNFLFFESCRIYHFFT